MIVIPENVDVNVHPTKHQVQFLHEDLITEAIQESVEKCLLGTGSSRTYYTQSLLCPPIDLASANLSDAAASSPNTKTYDYNLVRTDSKKKKLDAFVFPKPSAGVSPGTPSVDELEQLCQRPRKQVFLTSVLSLRSEIKNNKHKGCKTLH